MSRVQYRTKKFNFYQNAKGSLQSLQGRTLPRNSYLKVYSRKGAFFKVRAYNEEGNELFKNEEIKISSIWFSKATITTPFKTMVDILHNLDKSLPINNIKRNCNPEYQADLNIKDILADDDQFYADVICNKKNSYFEKNLQSLEIANMEEDLRFPKKCIESALKTFKRRLDYRRPDRFRICNEEGKLLENKSLTPPCLSKKYVNAIHNSFTKVMICLKIPPSDIYPLFTVESHFISNSVSKSGAKGLGHLIGGTIETINNSLFQKNILNLKNSTNKECHKISNLIEKLHHKSSCSAVNMPANPMSNFFYSAINWNENMLGIAAMVGKKQVLDDEEKRKIKMLKKYRLKLKKIEKEARTVSKKRLIILRQKLIQRRRDILMAKKRLKNYRTSRVLLNPDLRKVIRELTIYAHNWGLGGVKSILRSYLKLNNVSTLTSSNTKDKSKKFTGKDGGFLNFFIKHSNNTQKRKAEMANYIYQGIVKNKFGKPAAGSLYTISGATRQIKKETGGKLKCGSF